MNKHDESLDDSVSSIAAIADVPTILDICARATGMGFVAIARVTEDRWITCASRDDLEFGLGPGDELEVGTTICNTVRASREVIAFDDATADDLYCVHPTPKMYGFRSYISMPIVRADGSFFGTLCAIDPAPRQVSTQETRDMFAMFARLIAGQIDRGEELSLTGAELARERETSKLREQFIAVVGHDLRNPVAALSAGLRTLKRSEPEGSGRELISDMQQVVLRMTAILENLLDFARGRLGSGIELNRIEAVDLGALIDEVVSEIEAVIQGEIETDFALDGPVMCDRSRMGQLLSNLVGNAVSHGTQDRPVRILARSGADTVSIVVENEGPPIPAAARASLFEPFARGGARDGTKGLGLGLFIASEIARAHGGRIAHAEAGPKTVFTVTLPASGDATASRTG